ncbi:MAG: anti-virulence regulator CigR family protein [Gemmatimonadota bacterium]
MRISPHTFAVILVLSASFLVAAPADAFAQGRGKGSPTPAMVSVSLTPDIRIQIQNFYSSRAATGAEALPPGMRKRLARGKGLPPGIAKKVAPAGLRSRIELPGGFEIVEVGLDILLVEVATAIVHDVLMDVVR